MKLITGDECGLVKDINTSNELTAKAYNKYQRQQIEARVAKEAAKEEKAKARGKQDKPSPVAEEMEVVLGEVCLKLLPEDMIQTRTNGITRMAWMMSLEDSEKDEDSDSEEVEEQ